MIIQFLGKQSKKDLKENHSYTFKAKIYLDA